MSTEQDLWMAVLETLVKAGYDREKITPEGHRDFDAFEEAFADYVQKRKTAYMAHNRTSTVFFESREDAEKYAGQGGATSGIEVTEITIMPKGATQ